MTSNSLKNAIWFVLLVSAGAFAAGGVPGPGGGSPGGGGGGSGGGGGGGGGEEPPDAAVNSLSYPIFDMTGVTTGPATWTVAPGVLGTNFIYGCAIPDGDFPNTACLDGVVPMSKEACATHCNVPVEEISRIYKQKVSNQTWKSETIPPTQGLPALVANIDWGDALESRTSSSTSVVRVEAMPFYKQSLADLTGFQMWHVSGTGVDEMWGVRATDDATPLPYAYESAYAIMRTGYAKLHLAKLSASAETCPASTSAYGSSPYDGQYDPATQQPDDPAKVISLWSASSNRWDVSLPFQQTLPFNAELNIQGKYVYGYNWMLKNFDTGGVEKAGWWRLTFYAKDAIASVLDFDANTLILIPEVPVASPVSIAGLAAIEPMAETTGRLYVPVVKPNDDLTFIDVCISAKKGGGGSSRRPPNPGE